MDVRELTGARLARLSSLAVGSQLRVQPAGLPADTAVEAGQGKESKVGSAQPMDP
jgi:hypothetical protein